MSPRHHGQSSTSPGEPAGEVRSPRTFSITTRQGLRASTARTTWCHRPDRVPSASPARRPATETSLTGEAGRQDTHLRDFGPVHSRDVAEIGHGRPVSGQDPGRSRVDLGMPGDRSAEDCLDAEIQTSVPGAQTPDRRLGRCRRKVSAHGGTPACRRDGSARSRGASPGRGRSSSLGVLSGSALREHGVGCRRSRRQRAAA